MAKYRKIDPRIWNDAKFGHLSDRGKLLFMFLLTHPHMTSLGAMRANAPGLAAELEWSEKAFREAFHEVCSKGMAKHDEKASFVWLPNFIRYNPPESPNVLKAWAGAADMIPECPMKNDVLHGVKDLAEGMSKAFSKGLPEAFAKAMPNKELELEPEQEPEQEQEEPHTSPPKPDDARQLAQADSVRDIFDHWTYRMNKNAQAKLTDKRRKCIQARLRDGYDMDLIKRAIDGCASSPHHMGQNDAGTVYDDLTLICRSGDKLEWFAQNIGAVQPMNSQERVESGNYDRLQNWAERKQRELEEQERYAGQ